MVFWQLRRVNEADGLIRESLEAVLTGALGYRERAEAATILFETLRHWPAEPRGAIAREVLQRVDIFRDTFMVNRYFPPHKILVVESIVDCLADARTRQNDLMTAFLDREEYAIRRTILTEYRTLCGA